MTDPIFEAAAGKIQIEAAAQARAPQPPPPRRVPLPLGGLALMYSREQLAILYRCSHGELGRMLRAKMAPLPIRIDGQILWYVDEALAAQAQVERTLGRWRKR